MRLAGQIKQGFYPCPEEAVALISTHLLPPPVPDRSTILDPCAGEGKAVVQLADAVGIPRSKVYAIELNVARSRKIAAAYPDVNLLGPCSFGAAKVNRESFSLLYLNPPFDDEFGGGGREEVAFLRQAANLLVPAGILVLVCPLKQVFRADRMCKIIDTWFEDVEVYVFPPAVRKFGECVVFGKRRRKGIASDVLYAMGNLHGRGIQNRTVWDNNDPAWKELAELGQRQFRQWSYGIPISVSRRTELDQWQIPLANNPTTFAKKELTQEEVEELLKASPIYRVLETRAKAGRRRPPMPLGKGHTSLFLLTGGLDGYVPSDPPHVVRAFCGKERKLMRVEHYETPAGKQVEKATSAEVPMPVVRAAWPDGTIVTYAEAKSAGPVDQIELEDDEPMEDDEL